MQLPRLADLAFAELQEKLYRQEIPWKDLESGKWVKIDSGNKGIVTVSGPFKNWQFRRTISMYSVGKKNDKGEESRLVTFRIRFRPVKGKLSLFHKEKPSKNTKRLFTYQVLIQKTSALPPPTQETANLKNKRH